MAKAKTKAAPAKNESSLPFDKAAILEEIESFKATKLAPIREQIKVIEEERRGLDRRLADLRQLEAELSGKAVDGGMASGGRKRRTKEDKMKLAAKIHDHLKSDVGTKYTPKELREFSDGVEVRELVALWNSTNKDKKIHNEGNKSNSRYFVE